MASDIVSVQAKDGRQVEFVIKDNPPSGAMKYVYFSPNKDYVTAFFFKPLDPRSMSRLESITGKYRKDIFEQIGGDYWRNLFCWPETIVKWEDKTGIVVPAYSSHFFFKDDATHKGFEKEGKWFASAKLFKNIDPRERGNFLNYLKVCLKLSQAVRRMHAAGLAHSDLSYKNVLIDPSGGNACVIDVDGLVVPGIYPPDVIGTTGFIAPEVLCDISTPRKILPSQTTDRHALAVLIYMYLLHRHPLCGGHFFGPDYDADDEESMMLGSHPVYIEHPSDHSNCNMKREYGSDYEACRPWDELKLYSAEKIAGPFLSKLFERAFIDGIATPTRRPIADEWERAIIKTTDRLQPCSNPHCPAKWYVFDNTSHPRCPFCGTKYNGLLPKLEFYSARPGSGRFMPEDYQLMVFDGQSLSKWHVNKNVFPNEKLTAADKVRQGYFQFFKGHWYLVNEKLPSMYEIMSDGTKKQVPIGGYVILEENKRILLSTENGGRLLLVQMAGR